MINKIKVIAATANNKWILYNENTFKTLMIAGKAKPVITTAPTIGKKNTVNT